MSVEDVKGLGTRLYRYCKKFNGCMVDRRSHKHLRNYVRGQIGPLKRKNVEQIALETGTPVRTLQEFMSFHRWDEAEAASRLRGMVQREHGDPNAIAAIDESGHAKKGEKTAGVKRQWCGSLGKTENCVVSVHLGFVSEISMLWWTAISISRRDRGRKIANAGKKRGFRRRWCIVRNGVSVWTC
jgi:SRSO17 transposase